MATVARKKPRPKPAKPGPKTEPPDPGSWAARLIALRERLDISQEQFAAALDISVSTITSWETGRREPGRLAQKYLLTKYPELG